MLELSNIICVTQYVVKRKLYMHVFIVKESYEMLVVVNESENPTALLAVICVVSVKCQIN